MEDKKIKFLKEIKSVSQATLDFLELNMKAAHFHCEEQKLATIDCISLQKASIRLINQEIEIIRLGIHLN